MLQDRLTFYEKNLYQNECDHCTDSSRQHQQDTATQTFVYFRMHEMCQKSD